MKERTSSISFSLVRRNVKALKHLLSDDGTDLSYFLLKRLKIAVSKIPSRFSLDVIESRILSQNRYPRAPSSPQEIIRLDLLKQPIIRIEIVNANRYLYSQIFPRF